MQALPAPCKPLPAPSLSRQKPAQRQGPYGAGTESEGATRLVNCRWPGCARQVPEMRLDSDMNAYTEAEFAAQYAPVTGCTIRWERATSAAPYCIFHRNCKSRVLQSLGINAVQAGNMAKSGWFYLHEEDNAETLDAIKNWWTQSKLLFRVAHPWACDAPPPDMKLQIEHVYCVSNKITNFITTRGTLTKNRWTYDPTNKVGEWARNRKLLLHGAPSEKLESILDNDLGLSGCEVNSTTGQMLGEGLYVADSFMKSLQYATASPVDGSKYVLMVEVNVGKPLVCTHVHTNGNKLLGHSFEDGQEISRPDITFARGAHFFEQSSLIQNGWAASLRVPQAVSFKKSSTPCLRDGKPLLFNEWCVHNTQLYSIAYIVQFR